MRRRRLVAALVPALLVGAGCATVPQSTDVQVLRSLPGGTQVISPAEPTPGIDAFRLIRDFIDASGSTANDFAAARSYLTEDAAQRWRPGRLTVIDDDPSAVPDPGPQEQESRVRVAANRLGTLGPDGAFTPTAHDEDPSVGIVFDTVRENGEWRIAVPPAGIYMEHTAFQLAYQAAPIWFGDRDRATLVPDLRWIVRQPTDAQGGQLVDLLLDGPSDAVRDGVVSALPDDARLRSNVVRDGRGRTVVELAGLGELGEADRRLAAAQIVTTLRAQATVALVLRADGDDLVPGRSEWRTGDVARYLATSAGRPDVAPLGVWQGAVRDIDGRAITPPDREVLTAARSSPSGELLATVSAGPGGRPQLAVGRLSGDLDLAGLNTVDLDATRMTRPTWRAGTSEVWTVLQDTTVAAVAFTDEGPTAPYVVDAAELNALGPITDLRLSRDGSRVAAVVAGRIVVATVVLDDGNYSVRGARVLRPGVAATSVDWTDGDGLVFTGAVDTLGLYELSVDGLLLQRLRTVNLTAPLGGVTALPGRETLVSDPNGIWSSVDNEWNPLVPGIGSGAVPLYPG